MADEGRFPILYVPDDGRRYHHGQRVSIARAAGKVDVIPDPNGEYEVHGSRPAPGLAGDGPLQYVQLRRVGA